MLDALELRDFAIVDELRLELSPGLNVLTGETGAGKSILIDALGLLTGERADSAMVRTGQPRALVQGFFRDAPLESASRRIVAAGRSSARLDGEVVTVAELAARAGSLVAIHGQHASQTLMDPAEQRTLLDRLLPPEAAAALEAYGETFREHARVAAELERLRAAARERARRLDILQFQLDEIDGASLKPGEEERLEEEAERLRHAERILQGAAAAAEALSEREESAIAALAEARRALDAAARHDAQLASLAGELADATASVQAIADEIEAFLGDVDLDGARLERVESRIAKLDGLKRKYGESVEAVLAYRASIAAERDELENAEASLDEGTRRLRALEAELERLAGEIGAARRALAEELAPRVEAGLHRLAMPNARFVVEVAPAEEFTSHGKDRVRFLFSANLGEPPAPLTAVASGGELSRVMLALNVATGASNPTLVFDEVDAGIGGATARAVGELLRQLADRHQVLVVTHLAQVAAFADAQYVVEKGERDGRTVTRVARLGPDERERELARMLSGAVTEASLQNARELLAASTGAPAPAGPGA